MQPSHLTGGLGRVTEASMQTDLCGGVLTLEEREKTSEPISVVRSPYEEANASFPGFSSTCELGHLSCTNLRILPAALSLERRKMPMWCLIS